MHTKDTFLMKHYITYINLQNYDVNYMRNTCYFWLNGNSRTPPYIVTKNFSCNAIICKFQVMSTQPNKCVFTFSVEKLFEFIIYSTCYMNLNIIYMEVKQCILFFYRLPSMVK